MIDTQNNIRLQACLYVLFLSSVLSGALSLAGHIWPQLPVPGSIMVSTQGALALVFGGITMVSLMMRWRKIQRVTGYLLLVLGGYNIIHNLLAGPDDSGLSIFTGQPRLNYLPAICTILLGVVVQLGMESTRRRRFAMAMGVFGVVVGSIVIGIHLGAGDSNAFVLGFNGVSAFFCLSLSFSLIFLVWLCRNDGVNFDRLAAVFGALAVLGTFVLMMLGSWGIHLEQHRSASVLVDHHAEMLKRDLEASSDLISRLANRSATLSVEPPVSLPQTQTERERERDSYFDDIPALQSLLLVNGDGQRVWHESRTSEQGRWLQAQLAAEVVQESRLEDLDESLDESLDDSLAETAVVSWISPDPVQPLSLILIITPAGSDTTLFSSFSVDTFLQPQMHLSDESFVLSLDNHYFHTAVDEEPGYGFDHETYEYATVPMPDGPVLRITASGDPVNLLSLRGALLPCILVFGFLASYLLTAGRSVMAIQQQKSRALSIEEQRFRSLFFQSPDAVFEFSKDGRYLSLNPEGQAITGIAEQDLGVLNYKEFITEEAMSRKDYLTFEVAFRETLEGRAQTFSVNFLNLDGERRDYECAFIPVHVDGAVAGLYAVVKDITDRLLAQENQRLLTKSLESSDSAVLVFDVRQPTMPAVFTNAAFSEMSGFSRDEVLHSSFVTVANAIEGEGDEQRIRETIEKGQTGSFTVKSYRRNGTLFWNQLSLAPVIDDNGVVTHYTAIMHDVSEKKEHERQLAYQATHDVLTGLANRSLFEDRLAHDISLAKRSKEPLAVLFIDLDEFKPINDTLGHRIGDEILISIAHRMQSVIRPSDTLARFGGDEFVLLLPNLASEQEAEALAEQILYEIGQAHRVDTQELYLTASIGISLLSWDLDEPARMLQEADMAMYKAKQQGRDTFVVYSDDLDAKLSKRVTLRNELQEAIQNGQLFLNYQPQVDQFGEICGLEALVRWKHPVKGMIPPVDFIPIAEETGQIIQLGQWVLSQACRDAKQLLDKGMLNTRVAVNLSPLQFHRQGFLDSLQETLLSTTLPPVNLELELTEGILMHDSQGAIDILLELEKQGIATSIDDFGTGYSSFSYLKDLPVQSVKIDKSFVDNILVNRKDAAVCQGTITMAQQMGIKVVAEGVETQEQFELLKSYGCKAFQGYLFARPMTFDDLVLWMRR